MNARSIEPYRIFFPLGVFLGMIAVALWPLFALGWIRTYPGIAHARIMIEGFAACFIFGFMGTVLPHMLDARSLSRIELAGLFGGVTGAALLHLAQRQPWGDLLFATTGLLFLASAFARAWGKPIPPPVGLLVSLLGVGCAVLGAAMQTLFSWMSMPPSIHPLSKLLLNQGFLLLPVMGVGSYILPAFVGYPRRACPMAAQPSPATWRHEAGQALLLVVALLVSFTAESAGFRRIGHALRLAFMLVFLWRNLPIHRRHFNPGSLAWITRLAAGAIPIGYTLFVAWPAAPLAWLHVVFISGLGLLIVAIATRVIVAHSGALPVAMATWPPLWWVFGLIILAMATRVSADWMPDSRFNHYAYAAMSWITGMALWLATMRRFLLLRP